MSRETPCSAGVAPKVLTTFSTFTCIGLSHRAIKEGGNAPPAAEFTSFVTRASMVF
jgi:hypothetical protein